MVTYENLARQPHPDGWLGVKGDVWETAYRYAITTLQQVLEMPGPPVLVSIINDFNRSMCAFERTHPANLLANQWSYAVGRIGSLDIKHPFHFTPTSEMRWRYLPVWGWGSDARISDYLAMGALCLDDPLTGNGRWKSVKAGAGKWVYLDDRDFATERAALERTAITVAQTLGLPDITARLV